MFDSARYSLIFSDKNYMELMKICTDKGVSMGRMLNIIITDYVKNYHKVIPTCIVCGGKPTYNVITKNKERQYYCDLHFDRRGVLVYKKIGD